jgi:hypothetical protein
MISTVNFVSVNKNSRASFSYQNKNFLSSTKMNLEDSLNNGVIKEEGLSKSNIIPGKIKISDIEITEREKKLKSLAEVWKRERIIEEESSKQLFGFTKNSEILNGRLAMFFITTGLLTEIWTKQTMIGQIDTMLRIVGVL